jgi:hypothetical protein
MRWKIETFHKILKSGCRAEDSRLRTAERSTNLISIYCILSWWVFWMTMLNRTDPGSSPDEAFIGLEIQVLDRLSPKQRCPGIPANNAVSLPDCAGQARRQSCSYGRSTTEQHRHVASHHSPHQHRFRDADRRSCCG